MKKAVLIFRYIVIVLVYLILVSIFYNNYQNTVQIIRSEDQVQHQLIEESIYNNIKYANISIQVVEEELNARMQEYSLVMLKKYQQEPDILNWNFEELKNRFGNCEIYIIDQNFKVVDTTFEQDRDLDFKNFPSFCKLLAERLQGNTFESDRMDLSTNTGELMKYSYIPTPDHKYLLELSINIGQRFPALNSLDTFSAVDILKNQYPCVKDISIYKSDQNGSVVLKVSKNKPFYSKVTDKNKVTHIEKALRLNQVQIRAENGSSLGVTYIYKYIPYLPSQSAGNLSWWNSNVIEIVYDNGWLIKDINNERESFYTNIAIITAVYFAFVFIIIFLLHRSEYIAYHDHLTDLPNRKLFNELIKNNISSIKKSGGKLAVLYLDLNNFKSINDTLGHHVGDNLLHKVAQMFKDNLRKSDNAARVGGDEFIILLPGIYSQDTAINVAMKLNNIFKIPVKIDEHELTVKLSTGISIYPDHGSDPEELIKKADIAMYHAKKHNLNYMLYSADLE